MARPPKALSVRLHGRPVGELAQDPTGRLAFAYALAWLASRDAVALSLALPLRAEPYGHDEAGAFFGGFLPDSDVARQALGRLFHASASNDYSLLAAIGRDCAGAVSLHDPDDPVVDDRGRAPTCEPLDAAALAELLRALPSRPLFTAHKDVRLSLAGAQDKAAVIVIPSPAGRGDTLALPTHGSPSTHIVKPGVPGLDGYVAHEHLCLHIARSLGLPVVESAIRFAQDIPYLLVTRYDRARDAEGIVQRLHQEDLCQALGVRSAQKYENEGGPSLADVFRVLDGGLVPAQARTAFLDAVLLNVFLGNGDAHAKNVSLLHERAGYRLAPFYDLSCGPVYDLRDRQAMRIGGIYDVGQLSVRHWERLAAEVGYSFPALRARLLDMAERLPVVAATEVRALRDAGGAEPVLDRMVAALTERAPRIARSVRG